MQKEWWKKLSSESAKDRLPVVWLMAKPPALPETALAHLG